jgi:hypothetical protein
VGGVSPMVRSEPPFIGRRGRARGWPERACDMAVTQSAVISSGRDGRGSMGGVCRWWGDVGGALALQGDDGRDGEQWHLRTWSGDFFSSGSWGSAHRESRVWGHRGRVLRRTDWAEDGLAEVQGCTAQIVSLTLFDSCPPTV